MRIAAILAVLAATPAHAETRDPTATALAQCLGAAANASTAGQTGCETVARRGYDLRMNRAYAALMQRLPGEASATLRAAQRAWLAFRDADARARQALYGTRRGTMYVPMQAAAETAVTRDRALQLETALRVLSIDD